MHTTTLILDTRYEEPPTISGQGGEEEQEMAASAERRGGLMVRPHLQAQSPHR
jgi:hypothetical protein